MAATNSQDLNLLRHSECVVKTVGILCETTREL